MYLLLQADQRLKQNHEDLPLLAHVQELHLFVKEDGLILSQELNRISRTLRHGQLPREEDGEIEFWRSKGYLRNEFENSQHWSDEMWKSLAGGGGYKRRFQYSTDDSGTNSYFRALQGHSGRNPINLSLQDNVLVPDNYFEYIYHVGCAISLHSIKNSGLIPRGQNSSRERQTVFFTSVNPVNKEHKDPYMLHLTRPRLAWCKQKSLKKTPRHCVLGRKTACSTERIEVLSNKIERNHLLRHTPSLWYPESCCDGIWRDHLRESICVTSASSKDFFQR